MKQIRISYNAPVSLTFTFLALAATIAGIITNGASTRLLFMVYRGSLADPLFYLRLFTHVLGHADLAHFTGNFTLFLLLAPMVESKFGSKNLFWMILFTAGITGILNVILFPTTALCGASGLVFMLIILAAYSLVSSNGIPLTFLLLAAVYIGNEIIGGLFAKDNISQFAHILGGLCGGVFGFLLNRRAVHRR